MAATPQASLPSSGRTVTVATGALPQTTATAIFDILGGRVKLLSLVGEVTTIIETQANATKWTANPTTGTSVDICATLDITADEAGCLYSITGTFATAMQGVNAGACNLLATPVILAIGTLDLDCAASNTGSVKWQIEYLPIDAGAYMAAS